MTETPTLKHSYTVPCSSAFRDAVSRLALKRKVNVADLARSVLLLVPAEVVAAFPDPGEPTLEDREAVILKSGPAQGRPWRRKPRLQVRMSPGYQIPAIRRALALALAMDKGHIHLQVEKPKTAAELAAPKEAHDEVERLRTVVSVLAFQPLPDGVRCRADALHVLGFPPASMPDIRTLKAKFRMLATIHHPDSRYGNHQRMSQLNAAMDLLQHA